MIEESLTAAASALDEFLDRVPELDEHPFEQVVELALAAEYPCEWIGILEGTMVEVNLKLSILSWGMGLCSIELTGDSLTITVISGIGKGNIIETGPCPWYIVIEPLSKWLENHPEWMPIKT